MFSIAQERAVASATPPSHAIAAFCLRLPRGKVPVPAGQCSWSKEFSKPASAARDLHQEDRALAEAVAEQAPELWLLKKCLVADRADPA